MLEPIYLDLHIHTSEDADRINTNYDAQKLIENILAYNGNAKSLISLTDHNTINKKAYEKLLGANEKINVILGVELHIRNYDEVDPYHAHIFFKLDDIVSEIDNINLILDKLYPKKMVSGNDKIPKLEDIVKNFDKYDFIILPHGGQNHKTFDGSIPEGVNFDNTLERTIFYNQFDGFTSRTNIGVQKTIEYFKRLNINEFINLVTGTDNYKPNDYPNSKGSDVTIPFVPTWMLAKPTYSGLRISLSESNRLYYQKEKPEISTQIIKSCELKNDKIDCFVNLTPGLNVVIGESSSGKSLFIDSLYRGIKRDFDGSFYLDYEVDKINIINPHNFVPHYINQNFLVEKINNKKIEDIDIVKSLFPPNDDTQIEVSNKLSELHEIIISLVNSVKNIEKLENELNTIPTIGKLIYNGSVPKNPINAFIISSDEDNKTVFSNSDYTKYTSVLDEIMNLVNNNLFMSDVSQSVNTINAALNEAYDKVNLKNKIKEVVIKAKKECDSFIEETTGENAIKQQQFEKLLGKIKDCIKSYNDYYGYLDKLSKYNYKIDTKSEKRGDNSLFISNELKITEEAIINSINKFIKNKYNQQSIKFLKPKLLFKDNWSQRPKVENYDDLSNKIYSEFTKMNVTNYNIITKGDIEFDKLSPGWKTAVILDLIFNNSDDYAPLIIDQPEDNLASSYLNRDLIKSIHKTKQKRQVIIVSHNATIPMLGDAQNIIVCKNHNGQITIQNAALEEQIDGKDVVDIVAKLTDGGKTAIKKRFKKYNLKKYRGEEDEN